MGTEREGLQANIRSWLSVVLATASLGVAALSYHRAGQREAEIRLAIPAASEDAWEAPNGLPSFLKMENLGDEAAIDCDVALDYGFTRRTENEIHMGGTWGGSRGSFGQPYQTSSRVEPGDEVKIKIDEPTGWDYVSVDVVCERGGESSITLTSK